MRHFSVSAALIAFTAFVSPGAFAGDAPNPKIEEMKKRLEAAREALLKKKQELEGKGGASATGAGGKSSGGKSSGGGGTGGKAVDKNKGGSGGKAEATTTVETRKASEIQAELDRTRDERRKTTIDRLRTRWGVLLDDATAREELKRHAERQARLARIRALAEEKKKLALIENVDALVTKEELRHGNAMNALRSGAGGKP
jgi:hypothetical protein